MNTAPKIMIVRHAEKPAAKGSPHGVDINGKQDPESLIPLGWQRAGGLATLFAPSNGQFKSAQLAKPQFLFASGVGKHSNSLRPQETITPTSQLLGVAIDGSCLKGQEAALAARIVQCAGVVLVAWEHQDIPTIANAILGNSTTVPQKWPGDRFDLVWIFDLNAATGKYAFSQVPQMLLAGDSPTPIA
ncbi:MAG: hypothetical protein HZA32_20570 [Opitutae bacterium]|nr:hypothetical protein [Opitutae bacterium]